MNNKLKIIDLFCGCGGISSGFQEAGYEIIGGIDFNTDAIESFNYNFKNSQGYAIDLTTLKDEKIDSLFSNISNIKEIDIVVGGPPCQGFSEANRYKKEEDDPRNKLFYEFVKFIEIIKPKAFLMENVKGILTRNNGYVKDRIYEIFEKLGYEINHQILDSSLYGVPQKRPRAFFVGILNGKKFDFSILNKSKYIPTVSDAISNLYYLEKENLQEIYTLKNKPNNKYEKYLRNKDNLIYNHEIKYPALKVQERIKYVHQGGNWKDIPDNLFENNRKNRHSSAYKRLDEKSQSITIDTGNSHSNYFHPIYNRIPTVREAARLQSFKDEFIFKGSRTSQYKQVGNAVPPLLAKTIAEGIKEFLL